MLRLEETRLNLERTYGEQLASAVASGPVRLGSGEPAIGRVLGLRALPRLTQLAWTEGQARARGVVDLIFVYEEAMTHPATGGGFGSAPGIAGGAGGGGGVGGNAGGGGLAGPADDIAETVREIDLGSDELPGGGMGVGDEGYEDGLRYEEDQGGVGVGAGAGSGRAGGRGRAGRGEPGGQPVPAELSSTIWREALTFEVWADLPGADIEPQAELQGRCEVEAVNFEIDEDGRGLEVEVSLAVLVRAFRVETVRLLTGLSAGAKARLRLEGERVALENFIGRVEAETVTRGEITLAAADQIARQIIDVQVQPLVLGARVVEGGVEIEGQTELDILYLGQPAYGGEEIDLAERGAGLRSQTARLRWQARVDLAAARAGQQAVVDAEVAGMRANLSDDGRSLAVAITLALDVRVVEPVTVTLLHGVSGDGIEVATLDQPFAVEALVGGGAKAGIAEGEIEVSDPLPGFDRVLVATGQIHVDRIICSQDRVEVEGAVDVNVTYLADNWEGSLEVGAWPRALEFRETVVIAGVHDQDVAQVRIDLSSVEITPRGSRFASGRASLNLKVQVFRAVETTVVADAVEVLPIEGEPPTMRFVVVQPGDTLWRLATRYSTTPEALLGVNPDLTDGELPVGRKVYIPRRIVQVAQGESA